MSATVVRERPIIFSGEMVRAILDGRKTQTRRVLTPQPTSRDGVLWSWEAKGADPYHCHNTTDGAIQRIAVNRCPYGQPGDQLWVRETWYSGSMGNECLGYLADGDYPHGRTYRCRPSIHMSRKASRLLLEITEVRVQRLLEISEKDCIAEGVQIRVEKVSETHGRPLLCISGPLAPSAVSSIPPKDWKVADYYRFEYALLWDTLNVKRGFSWESNPWVWVLTFRRVEA